MLDEAAEQFQKMEVRAADLPLIHAYLGAILERRGQFRDAMEEYRRALALSDAFEWPHRCAACGAAPPALGGSLSVVPSLEHVPPVDRPRPTPAPGGGGSGALLDLVFPPFCPVCRARLERGPARSALRRAAGRASSGSGRRGAACCGRRWRASRPRPSTRPPRSRTGCSARPADAAARLRVRAGGARATRTWPARPCTPSSSAAGARSPRPLGDLAGRGGRGAAARRRSRSARAGAAPPAPRAGARLQPVAPAPGPAARRGRGACPVRDDVLVRAVATPSQTELDGAARRRERARRLPAAPARAGRGPPRGPGGRHPDHRRHARPSAPGASRDARGRHGRRPRRWPAAPLSPRLRAGLRRTARARYNRKPP